MWVVYEWGIPVPQSLISLRLPAYQSPNNGPCSRLDQPAEQGEVQAVVGAAAWGSCRRNYLRVLNALIDAHIHNLNYHSHRHTFICIGLINVAGNYIIAIHNYLY